MSVESITAQRRKLDDELCAFSQAQAAWNKRSLGRDQIFTAAINEIGRQLAQLQAFRRSTVEQLNWAQAAIDTQRKAAENAAPPQVINITVPERPVQVVNEIHPDKRTTATDVQRDASGRITGTVQRLVEQKLSP